MFAETFKNFDIYCGYATYLKDNLYGFAINTDGLIKMIDETTNITNLKIKRKLVI
ncbi:hypothetical protein [Spiroplasma endosymbiont of Stenodema calcarata]|uniref:hypothetical protein n=1 Tax=Spiroplasma endosymbiont of Stenodema calcarata TaxID=3139328 RepID=UPI003CCB1C8F